MLYIIKSLVVKGTEGLCFGIAPLFTYMSKNLEDLRLQTRSFLDEPIAADWTDQELNQLINTRYHQVYSAVIATYDEYAELKVATTDIVVNQQEYEVQLDFMKMRRVEILYDPNATEYQRAFPASIDQVRTSLETANTSGVAVRSPRYYLRGNVIGLMPIPTEEVVDGIKSWYYATVPDLLQNEDDISLPYPDRDWMLIVYGAVADALNYGQQEPIIADQMEKKFRNGIKMMQENLEDRRSDEYKGVIDVTGQTLDFGEWGV